MLKKPNLSLVMKVWYTKRILYIFFAGKNVFKFFLFPRRVFQRHRSNLQYPAKRKGVGRGIGRERERPPFAKMMGEGKGEEVSHTFLQCLTKAAAEEVIGRRNKTFFS